MASLDLPYESVKLSRERKVDLTLMQCLPKKTPHPLKEGEKIRFSKM